ncbi:MAG: hypothetical protein MI861_14230, partial [Pirellulales bacterium]|nr:hypothetical protein [Pirellulales bacterium]
MRFVGLQAVLLFVVAPVFSDDPPADTNPAADKSTVAGNWATDYGILQLTQDGMSVEGDYPLGTIKGTVKDRVLELRYKEANATGEAKFTFAKDFSTFQGTWREDGTDRWLPWNGRRLKPQPLGFDGLWDTSFGPMRLTADADNVSGAYDYPSGNATIQGQVKGKRLVFRYKEPKVEGSGWFELSDN